MARRALADLPDWPALLTTAEACAYTRLSPDRFRADCPVPPRFDKGAQLYCRAWLDAWLETGRRDFTLDGRQASGADSPDPPASGPSWIDEMQDEGAA